MAYSYNRDIQILRGISILCVLLYHVNVPFLKSGYLGVDIFFVISGFLMGALYADIGTWKDAARFYKKRLNRVLPAYYIVLFLTLFVSLFFVLPHEFADMVRHGLWSYGLAPNIGFWGDASYFETRYFKPFLNFWSLGVEIQFYLIFPLVIFFWKRVPILVVLGALGSFALCFYVAGVSPKTSFFMMPLRFWEFMIGFAAARMLNDERFSGFLQKKPLLPYLGVLSLIGMLAVMFLPFSQVGHLRYAAPVIAILTYGVLLCGLPKTLITTPVARVLEVLGQYSYSIYLVHFPVIALLLYAPYSGLDISTLGWDHTVIALVVTAVLSAALYRWVETPYRHGFNVKRLKWGYLYLLCAFVGASLAPAMVSFSRSQYPEVQLKVFDAWEDRGQYRCGKLKRLTEPFDLSCRLTQQNDEAERRYLLIGDSHADAIKETLVTLAEEHGHEMYMIKEHCSVGVHGCHIDAIMLEIKARQITHVILHSVMDAVKADDVHALLNALDESKDTQKIKVKAILPVPIWDFIVPEALYRYGYDSFWQAHSKQNREAYINTVREKEKETLALAHPQFSVVWPDGLCDPECRIINEQGIPLYYDSHHLTLTGARELTESLRSIFQ